MVRDGPARYPDAIRRSHERVPRRAELIALGDGRLV